MANLMAGFRIVGFFGVLLLWSHFSLGGEKKAAFDTGALKAAIKTSQKDFSHQEKSKNYRDKRVKETNKTGKAKTTLKIAGRSRVPNNQASEAENSLFGLGERKDNLLLDSTNIDFDSELEEVGIEPVEVKGKDKKNTGKLAKKAPAKK